MDTILRLKNIYKTYVSTNIMAVNNLSLDLEVSDVLAIVGDNGAGKTTLMKIIYGIEEADSGEVYFEEKKVYIKNTLISKSLGIAMVHQHDKLIDEFTAIENIILGSENTKNKINRLFFLDKKKIIKTIEAIIAKYSFNLDIEKKVKYLSKTEIKQIGIIKALYRDSKLIILDEPTASLSEEDAHNLYSIIAKLKEDKITVILITHRIKDIVNVSNKIVIMKDGCINKLLNTKETNENELANILTESNLKNYSCDIISNTKIENENNYIDNENRTPVISVQNICLKNNIQGFRDLENISFDVYKGEIFTIASLENNGIKEMEDILSGFINSTSGNIFYNKKNITNFNTLDLRQLGMSYVPSKRMARGVSLNSTVLENIIINKRKAFSNFGILNRKDGKNYTDMILSYTNIDASYKQNVSTLSGGNIQRLILSREIKQIKDYIILATPVQGIDFNTTNFIHESILCFKNAGVAVILMSSNINEILKLSDRCVVLYRGKIIHKIENMESVDENKLMTYMAGYKE